MRIVMPEVKPSSLLSRVVRGAVFLAVVILGFSITLGASGSPSAPSSTSISAGFVHTCAVTSRGGAWCWGSNTQGELGNPLKPRLLTHSSTPVDVAGLASGVSAIAAGVSESCALTRTGGVKCWGANLQRQLGNGTTVFSSRSPVDVVGLKRGVRAITLGWYHDCALTNTGGVKCWGKVSVGQGGTGADAPYVTEPTHVVGLTSGVSAVSAGGSHTCVITRAGGAKCWGANLFGQLGSDSTPITGSSVPVDVTGLTSGVKEISADLYHTCALTTAGGAKCWGYNGNGELGNGSRANSRTPADVVGLTSGISAITAGAGHTCALTSGGGVKCWGDNKYGQLGNGSRRGSTTPVDVVGLTSGVSAVSAGGNHTCALMRAGGAQCWGYNRFGQLGNGLKAGKSTKPVDVVFAKGARATKREPEARGFDSPSLNINCGMFDDSSFRQVVCQSRTPPQKVTMDANGRVTICRDPTPSNTSNECNIGDRGEGPIHPLAYGRQITVGRFRCLSLEIGVKCTVIQPGKGFLINRDGVSRVGR